MKNHYYLLSVILCLAQTAYSQGHPYEVKFSYQIEKEVAENKISPSRAGLLYSLIGDYSNSIQYSEIPVSWGVDTLSLQPYATTNALQTIIAKAKNEQIIIISENHLKPQHRIFARKLITALAEIGFDHLGLETFSSNANSNILLDSTLSDRGYPLNSPMTGTYTLEPQMGELVRTAIKSNLKLFAYERSAKIDGKDRDEIQADNIIKYLKSEPNAKLIILCGFHHAVESNLIKRGKSFWMAKYLKDKLGVDPMTIYQDNFTEKKIENEHPYLKSFDLSVPAVFVDDRGQQLILTEHVDFEVIHPKTYYRNGRPHWLYDSTMHKPVKIDIKISKLDLPVIAAAYPVGEINSVPVDRVEIKHKYNNKVLVLKPGKYKIVLNDGENTYQYTETVE